MKKVINMNLGGRLINIEEEAWARLQQYIESLKKHFANEEGRDEIVGDIENRIAEIFADKQKKGVTAISEEDVEEMIASIGRPEDFDDNTDNNTENAKTTGTQSEKGEKVKRGRLYRNSEDKTIGGVCSGIAAYFNIDVSLVRIIWAILVFAGGTGILLYILLWIVIPERKVQTTVERRLYRNPDDHMIGGVCGGIASYFGIEVWIPRLIFAFPFLVSIVATIFNSITHNWWGPGAIFTGSFGGTTLIAYIILWIVIPEAGTVSEKMAMRGEKVDLNTIKSNIQEEMKNVGSRAEKWGRDFTEKSKEWSDKVNKGAKRTGGGVGNAIAMLFKGFFLFIGGIIAFSLLVALVALLTSGVGLIPFSNFFFDGFWQTFFGWSTFIFFLLVPLLSIIIFIVRRARKAQRNRSLTALFIFLWSFGFVSVIFFIATVARDFSTSAVDDKTNVTLVRPANNFLKVVVREDDYHTRRWIQYSGFEKLTSDSIQASFISLRVEMSPDNNYHLVVLKESFGKDAASARAYAQNISFGHEQKDSVLVLDPHFTITSAAKFRAQHVNLVLQVPKGGGYEIDESVQDHFTYFRSHSRKWRRRFDKDWEFFREPNWTPNERTIMSDQQKTPAPKDIDNEKKELNDRLKEIQEEEKQRQREQKADSIQRDAQRKIDSLNRRNGASVNDAQPLEGDDEIGAEFRWPDNPFFESPLELMYPSAEAVLI